MRTLKEIISDARNKKIAVGHFNISGLEFLKAIFEAARDLNAPVIIGVSEGERDFIGVRRTVALIKFLREEYNFPVFLNADHTHSIEKGEEAARAGFDAVLFDGSQLPPEENIKKTKELVQRVKAVNPDILVEGELGYIGTSSAIRKEIPQGAAIKPEDLTKPEEAAAFVKETGIDLFAPAVGNLHGMFAGAPEPALDLPRVRAISSAVKIPLVLHGGSGNTDSDFLGAIDVGVAIVHISTEIRWAWRQALDKALKDKPEEIASYKIMPPVIEAMKKVVEQRLRLFNKLV